MAEAYALDSNVYIRAQRDRERMAALRRFSLRVGLRLRLNAVVALELRAGVRSPQQDDDMRALFDAYAVRDRVIVPSAAAYLEAGRVLAALRKSGRWGASADAPELCNDALVAASCREGKVTLVTSDTEDFAAIQGQLRGFRFVAAEKVRL